MDRLDPVRFHAAMDITTTPTAPILVTAATGKTGRRVAGLLTAEGIPVRRASRASATRLDWEDPATWRPALDGCRAVYLAYSPDLSFPGADEVVGRFAATAVEVGVRRIVLLSGRGEPQAVAAEEAVRASGADLTVLRSAFIAQNFSEDLLRDPVRDGQLHLPMPTDVGEPVVDADDIAEVAVACLRDDAQAGRVHELGGPSLLTIEEMTAVLAEHVGHPVTATRIPPAVFAGALADAGAPPALADFYAELFPAILDGRNANLVSGVPDVLGRPGRSFEDWVAGAAAAGAWAGVSSRG